MANISICAYPHVDVEVPFGDSITEICESLDLQTMVERASMGILDLNSFKTPLVYDNEEDLDNDVVPPTFGMSREQAEAMYNEQINIVEDVARANEKKTQGQPGEAAPGSQPSEE